MRPRASHHRSCFPVRHRAGEAIPVPHIPDPTSEQIDKYHALYVAALCKLYDSHKDLSAPTDFEGRPLPVPALRIVE